MKKILVWALLLSATAFADTAGVFDSPSPTCPPATCSGIGTNIINWGAGGDPSALGFFGNPNPIAPGSAHFVGTIGFYNGTITSGTGIDQITLHITTNYNDSSSSLLNLVISIVNTTNGGVDPVADADYITFSLGTFHVFEESVSYINVFSDENGDLHLGDPTQGGFVTPEPTSIALLGTGLLGGLGTLRKKLLAR